MRLGLGCGATVITLCLIAFGWQQVKSYARRRVNQGVAQLSRGIGAPVVFGRFILTPLGATLEDVRLGPEAQVAISTIDVDINCNPFSAGFAEIEQVTIAQMQVKLPESAVALATGRVSGSGAAAATQSQQLQAIIGKFFTAMPMRHLLIHGGQVTLVDAGGEPVWEVKGLKFAIDKPSSEVLFRVGRITSAAGVDESNVVGRFELNAAASDYRFFVKSKTDAVKATNLWAAVGSVQKDLERVQLQTSFKRTPSFLTLVLKDHRDKLSRLRMRAHLEMTRDERGAWQFSTQMFSLGSIVHLPFIASNDLGPLYFDLKASGTLQPEAGRLSVDSATLTLPQRGERSYGEGAVHFTGDLNARLVKRGDDHRYLLQGHVALPVTPCQTLLNAAPAGSLPALTDFKLSGDTAAVLNVEIDSANLEASQVHLHDAFFNCGVREAPFKYTAEALYGPLQVERQVTKDEPLLTVRLDQQTPGYAVFNNISRNLQAAFVASEDAAFYTHKGIDALALENALHRDLAQRRVALGGSTITMQTVKNLFLSQERTLARKVQELFLAWHLERTISKERILELYMNVAELGPGIYGVGQAATHFFGKSPFDLNLLESAYLATLLPSPKIRYRYFCRGELTTNYRELVHGLLHRMLGLGRISVERYAQAVGSSLHFNDEARLMAKACSVPPSPERFLPAPQPESAYNSQRKVSKASE